MNIEGRVLIILGLRGGDTILYLYSNSQGQNIPISYTCTFLKGITMCSRSLGHAGSYRVEYKIIIFQTRPLTAGYTFVYLIMS